MKTPICIKCATAFKVLKVGALFVEQYLIDGKPEPYRVWATDIYQCPKCGVKILHGFGSNALAHHYETRFRQTLKDALERPDTVVEDLEKK